MKVKTYHKLWSLIVAYGDARFQKGVSPIDSEWEKGSQTSSEKLFREITEILFNEVEEN